MGGDYILRDVRVDCCLLDCVGLEDTVSVRVMRGFA